jgi:hypothetical protein
VLSECIITFVITCFYIPNKFEKMNEEGRKQYISAESDDHGAFTCLHFLSEEEDFKTNIYRVVENSTGYPNIQHDSPIFAHFSSVYCISVKLQKFSLFI